MNMIIIYMIINVCSKSSCTYISGQGYYLPINGNPTLDLCQHVHILNELLQSGLEMTDTDFSSYLVDISNRLDLRYPYVNSIAGQGAQPHCFWNNWCRGSGCWSIIVLLAPKRAQGHWFWITWCSGAKQEQKGYHLQKMQKMSSLWWGLYACSPNCYPNCHPPNGGVH